MSLTFTTFSDFSLLPPALQGKEGHPLFFRGGRAEAARRRRRGRVRKAACVGPRPCASSCCVDSFLSCHQSQGPHQSLASGFGRPRRTGRPGSSSAQRASAMSSRTERRSKGWRRLTGRAVDRVRGERSSARLTHYSSCAKRRSVSGWLPQVDRVARVTIGLHLDGLLLRVRATAATAAATSLA